MSLRMFAMIAEGTTDALAFSQASQSELIDEAVPLLDRPYEAVE